MEPAKKIIIQGHRGARGLFPENTILSFIEAVKLGVDTLEMDVVISKDGQVVVSHEPWMNPVFCSCPDGRPVEENSKEKYNLFNMTYAEIKEYDCGMRENTEFPLQKRNAAHKPLLSEVILKVEEYVVKNRSTQVNYNIEIKSESEEDNIFNPDPKNFVELVWAEIEREDVVSRCNLQSFDVRILQEIKRKVPGIKLALLVENQDGLQANLDRLGFIPNIYSPDYNLIDATLINDVHTKGMQIIPWTVNEIKEMQQLIELGVDGIITDYPNRAMQLIKKSVL